jgi:hypothetical protein
MRLAMMLAIAAALVINPGVAEAAGITYTVEPFDFGGIGGMSMSVTQKQLGGAMCPCVKVPYPADGLHNDAGSAAIANAPLHSGDTVLGFQSRIAGDLALARSTHAPTRGAVCVVR